MKSTSKKAIVIGLVLGLAATSLPAAPVVTAENSPVSIQAIKTFKDVKKGHWAENAIAQATSKGFVEGFPDGTFRPSAQVTRAEFATFLARAIDGTGGENHSFSDVPSNHWATNAINEGLALGFIDPQDYRNNKFEPSKPMTRGEIAKWLAKGLASVNEEYGQAIKEMANSSTTLIPIPEFYKGGVNKADLPYIGVAMGTGLLKGYTDFSFKPKGNTTRAEVATILIRYLDVMNKQPTDFNDLNEFREVAVTGTNILSVSNFVKHGTSQNQKGFENIKGKTFTYKNQIGVGSVERMIVIDTTTTPIKGAYKDMFTERKSHVNGSYNVYIEYAFTPNKDIDYQDFFLGSNNAYLSGRQGELEKANQFGYRTANRNTDVSKPNTFLKTGSKNYFWGTRTVENRKGSEISFRSDDGSNAHYIIP